MTPRSLLLVAAGGALGTLARYGLDEATGSTTTWPWATFIVNIVGSFALGVLAARVAEPSDPRRLLLGTGLLGGFTTYSAFAVQTEALLRNGEVAVGLLYPAASVLLGLAAAITGLVIGRRRA